MVTTPQSEDMQSDPALVRRYWPVAVAVLAALLAVVAVAFTFSSSPRMRTVAIVDLDAGWDVDGERLDAGKALVESLSADEGLSWTVISDVGDAAAIVTIPGDFSESVASLWGPQPRQAQLGMQLHTTDPDAARELSALLSAQVGAEGVGELLADTATARAKFQQAGFAAGLLTAGTQAAAEAATGLTGSADQLLPLLETARSGATELLDVSRTVSGAVGQASGTTEEVAGRLDTLGLTLADVVGRAESAAVTLDRVLPVVAAIDPAAAQSLGGTSADLRAVSTQLASLPTLLGGSVDESTELGALVRAAFAQVSDASAQLSSAAQQLDAGIGPLADQAPEMLAQVTGQISAGFEQLNSLSGQVSSGIGEGMAGLPVRSTEQQSRLGAVLASPVLVSTTSAESAVPAHAATMVLAGTTIALAVVIAVVVRRRPAQA